MTTKRDKKKNEQKSARGPKVSKEKLRDLNPKDKGEDVKGGIPKRPGDSVAGC